MSCFRTLKYFLKILNSPPLAVSARKNFLAANSSPLADSVWQNFLVANSTGQTFQIRWVTSSKVKKPGKSVERRNAIDTVSDLDLSDYGSVLTPSFNFAAYADDSVLLQKLIQLGVNLYEIEKKPNIDYILTLKWENIEKYLSFLTNNGVPQEKLGEFITINPFIFKEDLEDLQVRINYLESKKFDKGMISNILVKNPKWLSNPVRTIDEQLGYLQQSFDFHGNEVRQIISTCPSLGTLDRKKLMVNVFTLKEDLYLDKYTAKKLVLSEPGLLRRDPYDLISTYDYLTKTMNVPLDLILKQAKVLSCRKFFLVERHLFLKSLGRAQYNHFLPGYISLRDLIETTDEVFCEKVARASIECFDEFLKTL